MTTATAPSSSRQERTGWYFYDWANSAFSTTVITVFLGPFLTSVTEQAAGCGLGADDCTLPERILDRSAELAATAQICRAAPTRPDLGPERLGANQNGTRSPVGATLPADLVQLNRVSTTRPLQDRPPAGSRREPCPTDRK